jgi:NADPH:quinone reductase-like Zn-dependent oxidoreductase
MKGVKGAVFLVGLYQCTTAAHNVYQVYTNTECQLKPLREGEWAVVTGASAGLGEQFAIQLARVGFNIKLVSRTKANLEEV